MDTNGLAPVAVVELGCWGTFFVVWAWSAIVNGRRAPTLLRRARFQLLPPLVFFALFALLIRYRSAHLWGVVEYRAAWSALAGAAVLVAATVLTLCGRRSLGVMYTASAAIRRDHQLHTDGLYGMVRHPIYTGAVGMGMGTALINGLGAWLGGLVLFSAFLCIKASIEERLLIEEFPNRYREYARRVPFMLPDLRRAFRKIQSGAAGDSRP
jgi:protein-S-isoprenylcysteine O-methyltransferase Ste14